MAIYNTRQCILISRVNKLVCGLFVCEISRSSVSCNLYSRRDCDYKGIIVHAYVLIHRGEYRIASKLTSQSKLVIIFRPSIYQNLTKSTMYKYLIATLRQIQRVYDCFDSWTLSPNILNNLMYRNLLSSRQRVPCSDTQTLHTRTRSRTPRKYLCALL